MLVLSLVVAAASQTPQEPSIIVTRLRDPGAEAVLTTQTLDPVQSATGPSLRLDDVLRGQAGFQLFRRASSRSANPTTQGITLRALGGNAASRALLLLDGVPQEDPFAGWVAFSSLPTLSIERVRITRGGGSLAQGAGALTGVIALESLSQPEGVQARASLGLGSFNTKEAAGFLGFAHGRLRLSVDTQFFDSDGFVLLPEHQRGRVDIPASSTARMAALRIGFSITQNLSLEARSAFFDETKSGGLILTPNANQGRDFSLRFLAEGAWPLELVLFAKSRQFSAGFAAVNAQRTQATPALDQFEVPADGEGARFEIRPPVDKALDLPISLRLGGDIRWAGGSTNERFRFLEGRFTRTRKAGGDQRVLGGFAEVEGRIGALTLAAGARLDHIRQSDGQRLEQDSNTGQATLDQRFPDRENTRVSGRAGVLWQASDAISLRTSAYTGLRVPTLNELYRPFRVGNDVTEANPRLENERLKGIDVGVGFNPINAVRLDLTFFVNSLDHAIANVTLGQGPGQFPSVGFLPAGGTFRQRQNLDNVRSIGLEAGFETPLPLGFGISTRYAFASATVRNAGDFASLTNKRLAQSPRHQISGQLNWRERKQRFGATLNLDYTSSAFEDDANTRTLPSALVIGASLEYRYRALLLRAGVDNLFDEEVVSALSADGLINRTRPRSIFLRSQIAF